MTVTARYVWGRHMSGWETRDKEHNEIQLREIWDLTPLHIGVKPDS